MKEKGDYFKEADISSAPTAATALQLGSSASSMDVSKSPSRDQVAGMVALMSAHKFSLTVQ